MAYGETGGPIVSVYKHAYYRSSKPLDPKSIVHAYGRVCKMEKWYACSLKPVRTPVAIFGSLGVCISVPASRHWLISYSLIHLT